MTHQEEIDLLRGRQLALIRNLATEDAMAVLQAVPVSADEELDAVADIIQRHILMNGLEQRNDHAENVQ